MVMSWLAWALVLAGLVLAGLAVAGVLGSQAVRLAASRGLRRVANSAGLLTAPAVRRRIRLRRWTYAALGGVVAVALVAAAGIAGRPVHRTVRNDQLANRDIMLCLDVSLSMIGVDAKVLKTFSTLVDSFEGERVGLTAWNNTAQTIVPLTDDYDTLRNQLTEVANALDFDTSTATYHDPAYQRYARTFAGTTNRDIKASSLDGDGLASCAAAMGNQSVKDRPRILILATDNQVYDDYHLQIYSLQAAADFATQNNIKLITLFGVDAKNLDPGITQADIDAARTEIKNVTLEHNGLFYEVDDPNATSTIVNEVESTQVKEARENTQVRTTDVPEAWALVLAGAVLVLLAGAVWRRA